ncbi:hypothetical protein EXW96_20835 [Paenibacillus sp. JMULE4]|uniref:hypothetical protein n=1 Tax=Paenibacillus sp. JMULE4 TaxID=2518342 RepID=UPI001575BEFB|nr:hypothetical protein [Paenibacillus sp. JMULE4]NTZ19903.1 hypothetical protein [Paenibacillus sp. JMULE4]
MEYNVTMDRLNQAADRLYRAINRMESAIMDAVEAYRLQMEIIRQMAERGISPETVQDEIERLTAEIEREINAAA